MKKLLLSQLLGFERLEMPPEVKTQNEDGKETKRDIRDKEQRRNAAKEFSNNSIETLKKNFDVKDITANELYNRSYYAKMQYKNTNYGTILKEYNKNNEKQILIQKDKLEPIDNNIPTILKWKLEDIFTKAGILNDSIIKSTYDNIIETKDSSDSNINTTKEENKFLFLVGLWQILSNDYDSIVQSDNTYKKEGVNYRLIDFSAGPAFLQSLVEFESSDIESLKNNLNKEVTGEQEGNKPGGKGEQEGNKPGGKGEQEGNKPGGKGEQEGNKPGGKGEQEGNKPGGKGEQEGNKPGGKGEQEGNKPGGKSIETKETLIDEKINKTQEAYNTIVMADYTQDLLEDLKKTPIKGKKDIEAFHKGIDDISSTIDDLKQSLDYTGLDAFIKNIGYNFKQLNKGDRFFDGVNKSNRTLNISNRKLEKNDAKVMNLAIAKFNKQYTDKSKELSTGQNIVDLSYELESNILLKDYKNKIHTLSENQVAITEKQSKIVELSGRYQTILSEIESANNKLKELNINSRVQNSSEKTKLEDDIKRLNKEKNENLTSRAKLNNEIVALKENLPTQEDIASTRSSYTDSINTDIETIENKAGEKLDELSDTETSREDMISRVKEDKQENKKEFEDNLKNISDDISKLIEDGDMTGLEEKQKNRTKTIEDYNKNLSQLNTLENTTYVSDINKFEIKDSVIKVKKNKIDEVRNSLSSQKEIANETKTSLQNNLNELISLQNKIGTIGTDSWNIEDQSPFDIDQEISNISELIKQKNQDIQEIDKQLIPLDTQSKDLQQESTDISTYISILRLQQRQDILQKEMDVYKIIGSDENPDTGLIPDTKKQVEEINNKILEINKEITVKEQERNKVSSTSEKQTIRAQIETLNAQKKGSESAKNTFESDLKKYESTYNSLSKEKETIDNQIKEIDPNGSKTDKIPEELRSITPETVGMISIDMSKYENIA